MTYLWKCGRCEKLVEITCKLSEIDTPPDLCDCGSKEFSGREIAPRSNPKVKQFILLGDRGWHDKEYTRYRSIR